MKRSTAARRGVTLIELLIAVSLLSTLSVGMLFALRVGINALDKANGKLIANRRAASVQNILESQIANFMPVNAACPSGVPNSPPALVPFFDGEPQSMRFVSSYSLEEAARGSPKILEFAVIPGEQNRGVRLIVNEYPYTGPLSTGALCLGMIENPAPGIDRAPQYRPIEPGPRSFVLADRLAFCRFAYMQEVPAPEFARWLPEWKHPRWPSAVRVEMQSLEPDPSRVPLAGLTVPIRINRWPNVRYTDTFEQ
ncbi:MAG TPA: prepilin-type N-terminal cleavage/methylation domain-containing protein [Bryobacteraceae bacterium]|nr:prepilin-type N-terminal cleavage/methylation domain-containing protein [Bryobacteraceae bacterium]HOL72921.1 prepilin-type N-terminal cleavage/methylation domain-containing protein [Bryobacteraceae bacterium]HOQ47092.1 prepilin-type N-terminal cleavage/methylation domain-containing protein [Bryobacteraceae bacterium]HPQ13756.1 prepilin-type N-terminal cleavage/methylation domain-containing protein [Bryobacteraceae bacterium]HPU71035.1 prepilin-type N-terminal cleavage/methylation domain-con